MKILFHVSTKKYTKKIIKKYTKKSIKNIQKNLNKQYTKSQIYMCGDVLAFIYCLILVFLIQMAIDLLGSGVNKVPNAVVLDYEKI